ncbi:hypothetical protein [Natronorubrum halophilum]|nr:hypothetical protein [Natronorubrum halophilum]
MLGEPQNEYRSLDTGDSALEAFAIDGWIRDVRAGYGRARDRPVS